MKQLQMLGAMRALVHEQLLLKAVIVTGVISLAKTSLALIGETQQQITARYGATLGSNRDEFGNDQRAYPSGNYRVVVAFENNASICESFFKQGGPSITPEEIADILIDGYFGSGTRWKASSTESWTWNSADGRLRAVRPSSHRLQVSTRQYASKMRAYNNAKSRKKPQSR